MLKLIGEKIFTILRSIFFYLNLDARKKVLRVSDQVIPKPAFSTTNTSYKNGIVLVASLNMILLNK